MKKNMEHSGMEWKFDKYDENFACLNSKNPDIKFVVRRNFRVPNMFEVALYYFPNQYREIKLFYSKEEAMSFVENLIIGIQNI